MFNIYLFNIYLLFSIFVSIFCFVFFYMDLVSEINNDDDNNNTPLIGGVLLEVIGYTLHGIIL